MELEILLILIKVRVSRKMQLFCNTKASELTPGLNALYDVGMRRAVGSKIISSSLAFSNGQIGSIALKDHDS